MSFLPESVAAELERLILSVRPSEPAKLVSIVSKHLTQVVSIAWPKPHQINNNSSGAHHADPAGGDGGGGIMMQDFGPVGAGSGLSLPPGAESRARAAADLLCAVAVCEGAEHGARDVARAVLKLVHTSNVARLRVSAAAVARFSRVMLECFTDDFEAVTGAIDDSLMEYDAVPVWLSLVARHAAMGDLVVQLWGGALCPSSSATASPGMFCGPWIRHQAHARIIDMLPAAIKNEEQLPLFSFLAEVMSRALNSQIGHFVDHLLIAGKDLVDAVLNAAGESAALGSQGHLTDSFSGTQQTPALPEALSLLTSMLAMLQRSAHSQSSFRGDYYRTLKTNTAILCFMKALPRLCILLNSDALATRPGCFGSARLRIVDAFMTLFRFNRYDSDEALFESGVVQTLISMCEAFPNHDVVLASLAEMCTESIVRTCDGGRLERYLVDQCRLQQRLVCWVREEKWQGTSLRALALTVAFGFAQRANNAEEDGANSSTAAAAARGKQSSNNSDNDDETKQNVATPTKKDPDAVDEDEDEDVAALKRSQRAAAAAAAAASSPPALTPSPGTGSPLHGADNKLSTSPGTGVPRGGGGEEWRHFVATDLPEIWKEWFSEITGFRFQELKSGGGRTPIHRPITNLTKNGRGGRHAAAHTVGRNASSSMSSSRGSASRSSGGGGSGSDEHDDEDEDDGEVVASMEEEEDTDRRIEKLFADARKRSALRETGNPSSPPLELLSPVELNEETAGASGGRGHYQREEGAAVDDDAETAMRTNNNNNNKVKRKHGHRRSNSSGEPFEDDEEEFRVAAGTRSASGATTTTTASSYATASASSSAQQKNCNSNPQQQHADHAEAEEEEEFRLHDIDDIDESGRGGKERDEEGEQDADADWVEKFIVEVANDSGGAASSSSSSSSLSGAAGAAATAEVDPSEDHSGADRQPAEDDHAPDGGSAAQTDDGSKAQAPSSAAAPAAAPKLVSGPAHDVDDDNW